jgi:hypothetical protein
MSRLQVNGLLAAAALLVSVSANAAEEEQPFKLDKREFEKKYKVIALAPPESDPYLQVSDGVKAMVEQEVTARLKKRGYTVMPSSVLGGIRAEMTAQMGGASESKPGQPDAAKQAAVREHAFRELWFRHQVDAVALMRIRVFSVPAENDKVEWDGTSQSIQHSGGREEYKANVSVSSVVVAIYDPKDAPLYVSYGGIEALMSRQGEQLLPLPVEQLLRDEKKIRKAAQTAVEAL